MERKLFEDGTYVVCKEYDNPSYQWIVYIKANGFLQEVYRSWNRTKKLKSYYEGV